MEKFRIYLLPPFTKNALSYIIPLSACMYFFLEMYGLQRENVHGVHRSNLSSLHLFVREKYKEVKDGKKVGLPLHRG